MSIKKKLTPKKGKELKMLGFLFDKKDVLSTQIFNADIMGRSTITPCLIRLKDQHLITPMPYKPNKKLDVWNINDEGKKIFLDFQSTDEEGQLILHYILENGKAQQKEIRKALHADIQDAILDFTLVKLCKENLLYKIDYEYDLTVLGKEVSEKKSEEMRKEAHKKILQAKENDLKNRYGDNRLKNAF